MSQIEMTMPHVPALAKFAQRNTVPTSPVVRAGDWVYVSGLPPVNPETLAVTTSCRSMHRRGACSIT